MTKRKFLFIVLIRALAAIIITNAHYTGVYPTDLIANGGLLGDVLFFSVSGFCLANTGGHFGVWYLKRFVRIYTPSWIITIIYMLLGAYLLNEWFDIIYLFIWPTHWHFVASIILLYIPLFFVSKYVKMSTRNYSCLAISLLIIQLLLYFGVYDYSYYHIDTVREPMIEFIFFQTMLLGLYYRWKGLQNNAEYKALNWMEISVGILLFAMYFGSKMAFVTIPSIAEFQIVNQIILWGLLYVLFDIFMKIESGLQKLSNTKIWSVIEFISDRTLEIYLVQYVILDYCKIGPFPLNWIFLTTTILFAASILHWVSQYFIKKINLWIYCSQDVLNTRRVN